VVLGEIGTKERAEYAVIGDTVNLASRLQALTRGLEASIAASAHFASAVLAEEADGGALLAGFTAAAPQPIDGYDLPVQVRLLPRDRDPAREFAAS
jgi:adenylate cyclase